MVRVVLTVDHQKSYTSRRVNLLVLGAKIQSVEDPHCFCLTHGFACIRVIDYDTRWLSCTHAEPMFCLIEGQRNVAVYPPAGAGTE